MGSHDETIHRLRDVGKVAVIGAGLGGISSAAHLLRSGLSITVFERMGFAGGVWHFDSRAAPDPTYPNVLPLGQEAKIEKKSNENALQLPDMDFDRVSLIHAPPGPCYEGLRNNVPTPLMRSTLLDWPENTPDYVGYESVEEYINTLAIRTGVLDQILFHTAVENVSKQAAPSSIWNIRTRTLKHSSNKSYQFVEREWEFDAIVVASGHYHVPRIPDIIGLKDWKDRLPQNVTHSKAYRSAKSLLGKSVFILGGGVSSLDIAKESAKVANVVYQSVRDGKYDIPASMYPPDVKRVGGIERVELPKESTQGRIFLQSGQILSSVDVIILCTGYITSYPFLGSLQDPYMSVDEADSRVIITSDGCMTHNLHKDIFYIPDPSLAFVGVPYHASAFSLFDFQAEVVARVFAGTAALPSKSLMRVEYDARKAKLKGNRGSEFHSVMGRDKQYMNDILELVNADAARWDYKPMRGVDDKWHRKYDEFLEEVQKRLWPNIRDERVPETSQTKDGQAREIQAAAVPNAVV
ncbi:FAD dependent oxidoreductase protein [Pochonia chlamydosporia 170]|uniref:FAD dependent oxidoreductase protein n=1 Tax=Pochonia chlamydosporia 170 TaxID=1380566 RepID=A0A179F1M4_METCM|nr:FAD dependent oxidoreductase protein [Pochonia chlamydosporia 170]OAQ59318.1 FAD dependent oxidoreductase protein [Pochonia chlamydosporia 170]